MNKERVLNMFVVIIVGPVLKLCFMFQHTTHTTSSWCETKKMKIIYRRTFTFLLVVCGICSFSPILFKFREKLCIENNICKVSSKDLFYVSKQRSDFYQLLEREIDFGRNIVHAHDVVPRTVHFIQYSVNGRNKFEFHHMLSVMSANKFIKPDRIFFWMDKEPESQYWKDIRAQIPSMHLIYRPKPTTIRGRKVEIIEHVSTVMRLEILLEYGGIYLDLDVIVVKSFDPLLKYDITMGNEGKRLLCNGVLVAKPWTEFMILWHREFTTYKDNVWGHHAVVVPGKLETKYPNLIHTEPRSLHHPSWEERDFLYKERQLYDWRSNNYACHLWIRFHTKKHNATDIKTWNTTVGELFRYVYYDDWRIIK